MHFDERETWLIKCFKIEQLLNVCNVNFTVSHSKLPQIRNFSRKTETTACHSPLDLINSKQSHNSTIVFLNRQPHKNCLFSLFLNVNFDFLAWIGRESKKKYCLPLMIIWFDLSSLIWKMFAFVAILWITVSSRC